MVWRMEIDPKVYQRNGEFVTREIAGEILMIPIRGPLASPQKIFVLNEVADFILSQIDGVRSVREIRAGVRDRFEAGEETVAADMDGFLSEMLAEKIIIESELQRNRPWNRVP